VSIMNHALVPKMSAEMVNVPKAVLTVRSTGELGGLRVFLTNKDVCHVPIETIAPGDLIKARAGLVAAPESV
jgi:hypothetical protein